MELSNIIGSGAKPYLEYGWVCAPNLSGQGIAANTITTLYLSDKVGGDGTFGSLSAGSIPTGTASATSQITLAAGTYYFKANAPFGLAAAVNGTTTVLGLYNVSIPAWVTRKQNTNSNYAIPIQTDFDGQITIAASSIFEMRGISSATGTIGKGYMNITDATLATAGADQRTTIKLWKLA